MNKINLLLQIVELERFASKKTFQVKAGKMELLWAMQL